MDKSSRTSTFHPGGVPAFRQPNGVGVLPLQQRTIRRTTSQFHRLLHRRSPHHQSLCQRRWSPPPCCSLPWQVRPLLPNRKCPLTSLASMQVLFSMAPSIPQRDPITRCSAGKQVKHSLASVMPNAGRCIRPSALYEMVDMPAMSAHEHKKPGLECEMRAECTQEEPVPYPPH